MRRTSSFLLVFSLVACAGQQSTPTAKAPGSPAPAGEVTSASASAAHRSPSDVERIFRIVPAAHSPKLGPSSAKVTLAVCSDFECPFCAQLAPILHELVENYGELVRVEWRNCPLPFHQRALPAAEAAMEVYAQGGDGAFWAYHDRLFKHQDELEVDGLVEQARGIAGIDAAEVQKALADHRHVPRVHADLRAIVESGATSGGFGTPATFVNGRLISGAQPYRVFEDAVERALQESPEARAQDEARSAAAYPMARLRHILIEYRGAKGADDKVTRTQDEARSLAAQLHQRIVTQGASLPELATQHSDCPSAREGGMLGRFTRGDLVPQIDNAVFALQPGEVSPVVESPSGYHVFLREE